MQYIVHDLVTRGATHPSQDDLGLAPERGQGIRRIGRGPLHLPGGHLRQRHYGEQKRENQQIHPGSRGMYGTKVFHTLIRNPQSAYPSRAICTPASSSNSEQTATISLRPNPFTLAPL